MDSGYPQKPRVSPHTGRLPQQSGQEPSFLRGMMTADLRKMTEWRNDPLYLFVVKVLEKQIRDIERDIGQNLIYAKEPELLAVKQGQINGIRAFEEIFKKIEATYNHRIEREKALNPDD